MSDLVIAGRCLLRSAPLWCARAPKTPLRVLCVIALDALHRRRHAAPMPRRNIRDLVSFLDLAACANAEWDGKTLSDADCAAVRSRVDRSARHACVKDYLTRLAALESRRPEICGAVDRFGEVRDYRESVVTLSLAAAAAIALDSSIDEEIRALGADADFQALMRIVMQCQIVDDVLDYEEDRRLGLPSFMTATPSPGQALRLTIDAARAYGDSRTGRGTLPVRAALIAATAGTVLLLRVALWRRQDATAWPVRGVTSRRPDRPSDDPSRRDTRRSPVDPLSPTTHRTPVGAVADRA
jgi:hypothetical protein